MARRKSSSTKGISHLLVERADSGRERLHFLAFCAILTIAPLFAYWPVRNHDFINFDDDTYVSDNPHVQSGLSWQSVRWAFTSDCASNWHPVTWLSHMLDCELFGSGPCGAHVVNLLFHMANTLLLFIVLRRMTGAIRPSAFVAAVFALHPLHVESVAWAAERKDVLSTFFWMLTMLAYAWYARKPKLTRYGLVLLPFALGLMAKPMLVTLPFVLLLLDYWPLERISLPGAGDGQASADAGARRTIGPLPFRCLLLEKVPLVVFSIASSVVTFLIQQRAGATRTVGPLHLRSRLGNAAVAYIGYVEKMFWPDRLAVLYPHPGNTLASGRILLCGLLLVVASVCFLVSARRRKYLAVGWLWYLGTLVPVIGLVQVGAQAMADRYTYVPLTGLFIIIAWGTVGVLPPWRYRRPALIVLAVAVISALAAATSLQLTYWQNSLTLCDHTLAVTSNNYTIHNNYAGALMQSGRAADAIDQLNRSIKIQPARADTYINLGCAYSLLGKADDAIEQYRRALSLDPNSAAAHHNLAWMLSRQKKTEEAVKEYYESLRLAPDSVDTLVNLGNELAQQGKVSEAIEHYRRALQIDPADARAQGLLQAAQSRKE